MAPSNPTQNRNSHLLETFSHLNSNRTIYSTLQSQSQPTRTHTVMRTTSSRSLVTALLLATTCLLSKFADGADTRARAHTGSTQVIYTENDEQRNRASFDVERTHLRTVAAGEGQRRHLSFWSSLLSKYAYTYTLYAQLTAAAWLPPPVGSM
jgi:hypothetical protein